MDDLPPPPPLPSLNESICNDFPSPPFIEMMGNMTVDRGTPLEGPQPNDPLPFQPRLPLESVQMVPTCMTTFCVTCWKKGRRGLLLLSQDACQQWYHRSCARISIQAYKIIGGNSWSCRHCHWVCFWEPTLIQHWLFIYSSHNFPKKFKKIHFLFWNFLKKYTV